MASHTTGTEAIARASRSATGAKSGQFTKGHTRGGRPKGRKNKLSGAEVKSVREICMRLLRTRPELFERAIVEGLELPPPKNYAYLAFATSYIDGKPVEHVAVEETVRRVIVVIPPDGVDVHEDDLIDVPGLRVLPPARD